MNNGGGGGWCAATNVCTRRMDRRDLILGWYGIRVFYEYILNLGMHGCENKAL